MYRRRTTETLLFLAMFLVMATWDWLSALSIRYISDRSLVAVPLAVILTGFWCVGVLILRKGWSAVVAALLGAAVGTAAGIRWL